MSCKFLVKLFVVSFLVSSAVQAMDGSDYYIKEEKNNLVQKRKRDDRSVAIKQAKISNIDEFDEEIIKVLKHDLDENDLNDDDVAKVNQNGQNSHAKIIHLAARRGMTELVLNLLDGESVNKSV